MRFGNYLDLWAAHSYSYRQFSSYSRTKLTDKTPIQQTFFKEVGISLIVKLYQPCPQSWRIILLQGGRKIAATAIAAYHWYPLQVRFSLGWWRAIQDRDGFRKSVHGTIDKALPHNSWKRSFRSNTDLFSMHSDLAKAFDSVMVRYGYPQRYITKVLQFQDNVQIRVLEKCHV